MADTRLSANIERVLTGGTISRHPSSAGNGQPIWPKLDELWEVIMDSAAVHVFRSVNDTDEYILATHYFCGRLQLIVCGLFVEELSAIGCATMLSFFATFQSLISSFALRVFWWRTSKCKFAVAMTP